MSAVREIKNNSPHCLTYSVACRRCQGAVGFGRNTHRLGCRAARSEEFPPGAGSSDREASRSAPLEPAQRCYICL